MNKKMKPCTHKPKKMKICKGERRWFCRQNEKLDLRVITNRQAHEAAAGMGLCDEFFKVSGINPDAPYTPNARPCSALEERLLYEVRVQFGAIERLLRAGIITQKQIGKARGYARRQLKAPNDKVSHTAGRKPETEGMK